MKPSVLGPSLHRRSARWGDACASLGAGCTGSRLQRDAVLILRSSTALRCRDPVGCRCPGQRSTHKERYWIDWWQPASFHGAQLNTSAQPAGADGRGHGPGHLDHDRSSSRCKALLTGILSDSAPSRYNRTSGHGLGGSWDRHRLARGDVDAHLQACAHRHTSQRPEQVRDAIGF